MHLLTRVVGVGVETADMLVQEVFCRNLRDRKAVARYAGLTGAPDESGKKRRERGLAKSGNARVRRGMLQLAWGFLVHQKNSVLAEWYRARTADAPRRYAQDNDRSAGSKAPDHALATGGHWRGNRKALSSARPPEGMPASRFCSPLARS